MKKFYLIGLAKRRCGTNASKLDSYLSKYYLQNVSQLVYLKLWCPLTPPVHEGDVYIENELEEAVTLDYLYDLEPIDEALLPPVFYVKKSDTKRIKLDSMSSPSKPYQKYST